MPRWMKVALVVGIGTMALSLVSSPAKAGPQKTFNKLAKITKMQHVVFVILKSRRINAWAQKPGMVTITTSYLERHYSQGELAFTLGHELAHLKYWYMHGPRAELLMDRIGARYAIRAGFSKCSGYTKWKRRYRTTGDKIGSNSHPSDYQRMMQMARICNWSVRP